MNKKIMFAAAEGLPFIKSGGLADVIGSLPQSLCELGHQVVVVLPMYKKIIEKFETEYLTSFTVQSGIIYKEAKVFFKKVKDVSFYFIRQDDYFCRDGLYGFVDDGERFCFYDKAVLELINHIDFKPDIIHCHDWHTGLIPVLGKCEYADAYYHNVKYVFTIHNLLFQGIYPREILTCTNLSDYYFVNGDIEFNGCVNFMKAAIIFADKVNTVSNQYMYEILGSEYGEQLDPVLNYRKNDLWGIVNGIDTQVWDPAKDKYLTKQFTTRSLSKRIDNKRALQQEFGLPVDDSVMLVGIVTRLTRQKGVDLIISKIEDIVKANVQIVILGTGDYEFEEGFKHLSDKYHDKISYYNGYNEELSHRVYGSCDLFLMPSKFEPCGVSQLLSMRYGTIPLVRETGGLKDTVTAYNEYTKKGNGFSFVNFNGDEFVQVFYYALNIFQNHHEDWENIIKQAMKTDVSWDKSAKLYDQMYNMM